VFWAGGEAEVSEQMLHVYLQAIVMCVEDGSMFGFGPALTSATTGQQGFDDLVAEENESGYRANSCAGGAIAVG
jgi:hypothetical protein